MVIGTHMRSVEPWHFRRPWVTFEGHFGDLLTVATSCAQLTRDLLAIAKFLVLDLMWSWRDINVNTVLPYYIPTMGTGALKFWSVTALGEHTGLMIDILFNRFFLFSTQTISTTGASDPVPYISRIPPSRRC